MLLQAQTYTRQVPTQVQIINYLSRWIKVCLCSHASGCSVATVTKGNKKLERGLDNGEQEVSWLLPILPKDPIKGRVEGGLSKRANIVAAWKTRGRDTIGDVTGTFVWQASRWFWNSNRSHEENRTLIDPSLHLPTSSLQAHCLEFIWQQMPTRSAMEGFC